MSPSLTFSQLIVPSPPIPRDGLHQLIGFPLERQQFPVNRPHPLGKIHPVVLRRSHAHIGAGDQ